MLREVEVDDSPGTLSNRAKRKEREGGRAGVSVKGLDVERRRSIKEMQKNSTLKT